MCVSIGSMSSNVPDWTIQIPGTEGHRLTDQQRDLLQDLEDELVRFGRTSHQDVPGLQAGVTPVVLALVESGMSAGEIADNSRLRPQFVQMIVDGGNDVA